MEPNRMFLEYSPQKLFFTAAVPGMISMFAASLYMIVEGMFIGRYLGSTAFAAVNLAMPLMLLTFSLADMIGVGSSIPISIALGRGDEAQANRLFSGALLLIVAAAASVGVVMAVCAPYIFRAMGAEGEVARLATLYIRIYALCGPLCSLVFAMDNFLRICSFIRGSMYLNIFMSLLTVVLLWVFLVVLEMGVAGAALASCVSMSLCALLALIPFLRRKTVLKLSRPQISLAMLRQIVACGSPAFLNNIAERLTGVVMNVALLRLGGEDAVAVYGVLMYAGSMVFPFLYGMNDSLQPAMGYNWGAEAYGRVRALRRWIFGGSAAVSGVAVAAMLLIPAPIASLFVEKGDPALLQMAAVALQLFSLSYVLRWFSLSSQSFFSAIGKPAPAALLSISSTLIFPLLVMLLLWPLGLNGLWLNLAGTALLAAVLAAALLLREEQNIPKA